MLALLGAPANASADRRGHGGSGSGLIVKQQNLSRRVTADQYRAVLAATAADAAPAVAPADDGERATRGVAGLREDVWPALRWGAANAEILGARLAAIRTLDAGAAAARLALEWLPDATKPQVNLHVVMGGRAGAAAIGHDIYFDVLVASYPATLSTISYPLPWRSPISSRMKRIMSVSPSASTTSAAR